MGTKKRVGIVFGGRSGEHEISLLSAYNVIKALDTDSFEATYVGITEQGEWLLYTGDPENIPDGSWQADASTAAPVGSLFDGPLSDIDIFFPVLHGTYGEDGTIQGLFEMMGKAYVGCGVLASAACMDKSITKAILRPLGIPMAYGLVLDSAHEAIEKIESELEYPVFVKPSSLGSSVGVSKAYDRQLLAHAINEAFIYSSKVLVEEFIDGFEIEAAVLGNEDPIFCGIGQIVPCNDFYDYDAKYLRGDDSEVIIPAQIPEQAEEEIRQTALKAYREMGLSGLSRLDFFYTKDGRVVLNEINTMPGFTNISMYPKLCANAGIPYSELISRLISLGFERHAKKNELKYKR
ncbi:MAG: D-alanine--D-alanine ligase [Eubacteriaceae bacterium]|nr:D-alanine--D-alanine ligase [Eubacteriaceae bacterium]